MSKSITNNQQSLLRGVTAGLFALMLAVFAMPAQAQMDDGELPSIDWGVNLMQSAQYVSINPSASNAADDPIMGFHRARAGITANVQFAEGVSGLLMVEQEPNDFGGSFGLGPSVDFMVMNIQATPNLTVQAGTPVTGLVNFRGFSDGPVVQGNPLISNSPADIITAGEGVKLIGSYDTFGFDLTAAKTFGEDLTTAGGGNTGLWLIGNARYTGSDVFKIGAGVATATGQETMDFARGDRENINLNINGQSQGPDASSKNTHAAIPNGGWIAQVDGKVTPGNGFSADLWAGYASESDAVSYTNTDGNPEGGDAAAAFGGVRAKFDVNDNFYVAGQFVAVSDQSDNVDNAAQFNSSSRNFETIDPDALLTRITGAVGYSLADNTLLKVEGFTQSQGDSQASVVSPTALDGFSGVMTELSFNF